MATSAIPRKNVAPPSDPSDCWRRAINPDIRIDILLTVHSAAYDLLPSVTVPEIEVEQDQRNLWGTMRKSWQGVMGVLWSFKLQDDLAAPYNELPDIEKGKSCYPCWLIGYSETPLGIP